MLRYKGKYQGEASKKPKTQVRSEDSRKKERKKGKYSWCTTRQFGNHLRDPKTSMFCPDESSR